MALMNGKPRLIDPKTNKPFEHYENRFAQPPVLQYSAIINQSMQVYSAIRRDEAIKFGRRDALAMERDTFLQSLMLERYEATALLKWHIEPEDPKNEEQKADAAFMQKVIERTPYFQQYRMNLLYAIWFGRAGVQHVISRTDWQDKEFVVMGRPCWGIRMHAPVRGDKIEFSYQLFDKNIDEGTPIIFLHGAYQDEIERQGGKIVRTDQSAGLLLTPGYWRERFVVHKHLTKDWDPFEDPERQGCIHGFGVRDQVFYMDWVRKEWLANVSDFIDQIGKGCQLYPYDASNPENEEKAKEAAKKQSRNTVIVWPIWPGQSGQVLPTSMNVPMDGSRILLDLMKHMEEIEERYIIGQAGSSRSDTEGMGTHSTGFMEDTKYRRIRWDAQNLDETITEQLLAVLHRINRPDAKWKLYFRSEIDKPNALEMLKAGQVLYSMDVPVKHDELRTYAGYTKPDKGDEVASQSLDKKKELQMQMEAQQQAGGGEGEAQATQIEAQAKQQEIQAKSQADQQKHQLSMKQAEQKHKLDMEKLSVELMALQKKHEIETAQAKQKYEVEMANAAMQHKMQQEMTANEMQAKMEQARAQNEIKQQQQAVQAATKMTQAQAPPPAQPPVRR